MEASRGTNLIEATARQINSTSSDNPYFRPKICIAWIIGIEKYDQVRNAAENPKPKCLDLHQVPEDISNM